MTDRILKFLTEISGNNNRQWFADNKSKYEAARNDFIVLMTSLHREIAAFDEDIRTLNPRECIFRIFRDVRFSKDKAPYKTNFGAYFNKNGKKTPSAGYYFHLEPGNCFLSGGIYMPPPDVLKSIRQEIYYNFDEFTKIISAKKFCDLFGDVTGDKLQRLPTGFPNGFQGGEYLKLKDYYVNHFYQPTAFSEKELISYAVKVFREMKPLNDFLNRALTL
ncbi:MAG TPA: DUF2461 domain-containing protein [Bacteroidales bacterium]|mgnify:CR=1 FL=1|nr:DUF2461 domain-containing protein [Bacteroidales bacterium]